MKNVQASSQDKKMLILASASGIIGFILLILDNHEFFAFFAIAAMLLSMTNPRIMKEEWQTLFNVMILIAIIAVFASKMYVTGAFMIGAVIYTYYIDKEKVKSHVIDGIKSFYGTESSLGSGKK